ncbi:MAG: membrane protein required for colicin V production [Granulosicoccus sp.]
MSEVDLVILAVIIFSAIISFMRGFRREAMSLLTWSVAIAVTLAYTSRFSVLLPIDTVQSPQARATISALSLFVGTLFMGGIINWVFERIMSRTKIGMIDRASGVGFGMVRGVIIVSLLVLVGNLVPELKQEVWWRNSAAIPQFQKIAKSMHAKLPDGIAQHFDFTPIGY